MNQLSLPTFTTVEMLLLELPKISSVFVSSSIQLTVPHNLLHQTLCLEIICNALRLYELWLVSISFSFNLTMADCEYKM